MQKTKRKPKIVKSIPPLKIINYSKDDTQANINGILTQSQKEELRKPVKILALAWLVLAIVFSFVHQGFDYDIIVIPLMIVFVWYQLMRQLIVKDIKIESFTGTARPYRNGSSWYLAFDDVMTFETKDQPNKLFKPEHKYRVFMTDKDNIILSARALDS